MKKAADYKDAVYESMLVYKNLKTDELKEFNQPDYMKSKIWEDTFYSSPRRVYGFYTKEELQWLIQKRTTIKDLRKATINTAIANRPYQFEAINRVAETFVTDGANGLCGNKRRALL